MQLDDFRRMVDRMAADIPPQYLEGITGIEVSPRTVPHPARPHVFTLGECVPLDVGADPAPSRVVLYHGSFRALARRRPDFDWRGEAWETLTHELRHHLEWRARTQELEEYDWAAEQGFARSDDLGFDPLFFLSGEPLAPGTYQVDDDVFIDRVVRRRPATLEFHWHGTAYRVALPDDPLPLYLIVSGVAHPPAGDLIVVARRKPRLFDLFRRAQRLTERPVTAVALA